MTPKAANRQPAPQLQRLPMRLSRIARAAFSFVTLCCLAACASHTAQRVDDAQEIQEAQQYQSRARGGYQPPGTAADPWGPYIAEAARSYDVPETWIREVMHQESGGNLYRNGGLVTSWVGAMGLMQVMPSTYDELKVRYTLGEDAYDPHDNIMAGAAYMREMYDIYGSPGFLAAYNAGPRRLDDYLANLRPLPAETRNYVARIGPNIEGVFPAHRSPAESYAMNDLPNYIPPGLRYGGSGGGDGTQVARAPAPRRVYARARPHREPAFEVAELRPRGRHAPGHAPATQAFAAAHSTRGGWHLISSARAETLPLRHGSVQIAAFGVERGGHASAHEHASAHVHAAACKGHACRG
jgi:hypothetical protein